jgi:hypothetical protein
VSDLDKCTIGGDSCRIFLEDAWTWDMDGMTPERRLAWVAGNPTVNCEAAWRKAGERGGISGVGDKRRFLLVALDDEGIKLGCDSETAGVAMVCSELFLSINNLAVRQYVAGLIFAKYIKDTRYLDSIKIALPNYSLYRP